MEVTGFLGDVGSGKTASAVYYINDLFRKNHPINSNIKLNFHHTLKRKGLSMYTVKQQLRPSWSKPTYAQLLTHSYNLFHNTNWEKTQDNTVFFLDEIGLGGAQSTRRLRALEETLAQARKILGENGYVIFTTQLEGFLSSNLKALTNYLIYPVLHRHPKTKIPVGATWNIFKRMPLFNSFYFVKSVEIPDIYTILNYYDTTEIVDRIGEGTYEQYAKKYKQFIQPSAEPSEKKLLIKELTIKLQKYDGRAINESKRLAESIVNDW